MQNNNNDTLGSTISTWLLSQPTVVVVLILCIAGLGDMLVQANERNKEAQAVMREALERSDSLLIRCYGDRQEELIRILTNNK